MGVLAQFPAKIISQPEVSPTLAREITTQDLQNICEDLMGLLTLLYENTDFAIVSGVNYLGGNYYSNGVIILFGIPYYFPGGALLNKYLIPDDDSVELSITGVYNDNNTYPIYRLYSLKINNTAISGSSPQFIGNMIIYRKNIIQLINKIVAINSSIGNISGSGNYVLWGCVKTGNNISDGQVVLNGIVYYLPAQVISGTPDNYIVFNIINTSELTASYQYAITSFTLWGLYEGYIMKNINTISLNTLNSDIATINSDIATIDSDIATINSDIATIESEITTIIADNPNNIKTKKIEINDWCMYSTDVTHYQSAKNYAHGFGANIVAVDVVICNDSGVNFQPITAGGYSGFDSTNVILHTIIGGAFDDFNHVSFGSSAHRGWIIVRSV